MNTVVISLLIATFLPLVLALASIPLRFKVFGKLDLNNPRAQAAKFEGMGERLVYAQANAWEALALYGGAILAMIAAGADLNSITTAATVFIGARVLHAVFYIAGFGMLRFLSFGLAVAAVIWIFTIAIRAI